MSTTTTEVKTEQAEATTTTEPQRDADEKLGEEGLKALHAERAAAKAEKKRADALEAEVAKLRQATETESQRIQRERDEAVNDASAKDETIARKDAMIARYEAAEAAGLSLSWAKRLVGSNADELLADAKAMAADLAEKTKPGTPKPDPSQGASGGSGRANTVAQAMADYRAERDKKNPNRS